MDNLAEQLLEWASKQSLWQRDLLRRIAEGELVHSDTLQMYAEAATEEHIQACKNWTKTQNKKPTVTFYPLGESHLSKTDAVTAPVTLQSIQHLQGANYLAPSAMLEFQDTGINIVAGSNGSGKSGYTRILKQVAASRAPSKVLPNVYKEVEDVSAVITFAVGTTSSTCFTWSLGTELENEDLRRINVFDTHSAQSHLSKASEIAYVPPSLQILAEYVLLLQEISLLIEHDLENNESNKDHLSELSQGIGEVIVNSLGSASGLTKLNALKDLENEQRDRLEELPGLISTLSTKDPAKLAMQANHRIVELKRIKAKVSELDSVLSAQALKNVETCYQQKQDALAAVNSTAKSLTEDPTMAPGTGDATWQRMWEAAKKHITENHQELSQLYDCPLCQQELGEEARTKFNKFENFIKNEAQQAFKRAEGNWAALITSIKNLNIPEGKQADELKSFLSSYEVNLAEEIGQTLTRYVNLRDWIISFDEHEGSKSTPYDQNTLQELAEKITHLHEELDIHINEECEKEAELLETSWSADAIKSLRDEHDALTMQDKLFNSAERLRREHDRRLRVMCLEKAKKDCSTAAATRRNKELSRTYVNQVCDQFKIEARGLGLDRVPVELVFDKSSKGVNYIKVELENTSEYQVTDVLSEGEQRVSAIAGFFADLTESGDESLLIFDDPVSSLDQRFRRRVAQRLIRESERRQIIIFTHDVSFVRELYEQHRQQNRKRVATGKNHLPDLSYRHITRTPNGTGVPTDSEHWHQVTLKKKIGSIRNRIAQSRKLYTAFDEDAYLKESKDITGSIRECWEILVEQELLADVVGRFKPAIETKKLKDLIQVTEADIATIENGMDIESRFMRGHAPADDDRADPLTPDELEEEITDLDNFRRVIIKRREENRKKQKVNLKS